MQFIFLNTSLALVLRNDSTKYVHIAVICKILNKMYVHLHKEGIFGCTVNKAWSNEMTKHKHNVLYCIYTIRHVSIKRAYYRDCEKSLL